MIKGSIVALVTPMDSTGEVQWDALEQLVEWHISSGTDSIVSVGTTGESPTLDVDEHMKVIEATVKTASGRIPIIAGTGSNSTAEAVAMTQKAADLGADATLQVVPYYNKPTQEGLLAHYTEIADKGRLPVILYNVPGRTVVDLLPETIVLLAKHTNIIGVKEATGDLTRGRAVLDAVPDDFHVYSGDDPTATELMLMGGKGNISVTANVAPAHVSKLCALALAGEREKALALDSLLAPLNAALFLQSNPIPAKWALTHMNKIGPGIRLPLTPLSSEHHKAVVDAIDGLESIEV